MQPVSHSQPFSHCRAVVPTSGMVALGEAALFGSLLWWWWRVGRGGRGNGLQKGTGELAGFPSQLDSKDTPTSQIIFYAWL